FLVDRQHDFGQQVESLLANSPGQQTAREFDLRLRSNWPFADVGYVVTLQGDLLSPSPTASLACATFYSDFGKFLGNRESAEVYWSSGKNNFDNNGRYNNSVNPI